MELKSEEKEKTVKFTETDLEHIYENIFLCKKHILVLIDMIDACYLNSRNKQTNKARAHSVSELCESYHVVTQELKYDDLVEKDEKNDCLGIDKCQQL